MTDPDVERVLAETWWSMPGYSAARDEVAEVVIAPMLAALADAGYAVVRVPEGVEIEHGARLLPTGLGKADWQYDDEWDMHIPGCSRPKGRWRCGNGPLTGAAIATGDCGEDHGCSHLYDEEGSYCLHCGKAPEESE